MERDEASFEFVESQHALPSVEIDVDSVNPDGPNAFDICLSSLKKFAADNRQVSASAYSYFTQSVNFGEQTSSEFFMIAGPVSALDALVSSCQQETKLRFRRSDFIKPERHQLFAHIEDGQLWQPIEAGTWAIL